MALRINLPKTLPRTGATIAIRLRRIPPLSLEIRPFLEVDGAEVPLETVPVYGRGEGSNARAAGKINVDIDASIVQAHPTARTLILRMEDLAGRRVSSEALEVLEVIVQPQ